LEDGDDDYVYFSRWLPLLGKQDNRSQGLTSQPNNCQLKLSNIHQVNRISVISGVIEFCYNVSWKSSGNLFGWICRHPEIICTLQQTDNHISTSPHHSIFYRPGALKRVKRVSVCLSHTVVLCAMSDHSPHKLFFFKVLIVRDENIY